MNNYIYVVNGETTMSSKTIEWLDHEYVLFISFDLDAESAEIYRGSDPNTLSRGRFAVYRGVDKILKILRRYNVKTTFFTPSWVIENYSELIERIVGEEHEVAAHGYLHERFDELTILEEEAVFSRTKEIFREVIGYEPSGFRSPYWRWSGRTIEFLTRFNYLYDSSLMDDETPYILEYRGKKIVELPVDWRLDDWPYLEYYRSLSPQQLLQQWMYEIEYARENRGYLSITMHPQCIGRGARIGVLEKILEYAIRTNAWIPRGSELAEYLFKKQREYGIPVRLYREYG